MEEHREQRARAARIPMLILGATMTIIYIGLGSMLLLNKNAFPGMQAELRNIFAVMLLVYGTYRGWRIYSDYF